MFFATVNTLTKEVEKLIDLVNDKNTYVIEKKYRPRLSEKLCVINYQFLKKVSVT